MASKEFWISYNNHAESLQLPVNPGEYTMNGAAQNVSNMVAGIGEVVTIQDPSAYTITFASHFPKYHAPYCATINIPNPMDAVYKILKWRGSGDPVRFTITGTYINWAVSIESFNWSEKGGDPDTIWYELTLKTYEFVSARKVDALGANNDSAPRPNALVANLNYTLVKGDSLFAVAKKFYGDGSLQYKIAAANNIKAPWIVNPGVVLVIP